MSCATIMTKDPLTLRYDESVGAAAERLVAQSLVSLPVVDSNGRYAGMFGIHDLLGLLVPRVALAGNVVPNLRFVGDDPAVLREAFQKVKSRSVGDAADRSAPTLAPDTPETEAIRFFCQKHVILAVVQPDSGSVVGTVSCWDAIRALGGDGA